MRRLVLFATAVSLGCSYPEFHFVPSDSATIADTAIAIDSTPVDTFEPPVDTGMDTAVVDTRVVDTTPEAPPPSGCAGSAAKFCSDWDKATAPDTDWTFWGADDTGSLALDMGGGRSAPNAFLATTSPGAASVVTANLSKTFTTTADDSLIKLDAWIKLETETFPTTSGGAFLLKIQRGAGVGDGVTFSLDDVGFYVDRIGVTYEAYTISSYKPKVGTWMHVRVHTRVHTTNGSLAVWIDNMTTPVFTRTAVSTAKADSTSKQAIVGLYSQNATTTFRARYDDVELDW